MMAMALFYGKSTEADMAQKKDGGDAKNDPPLEKRTITVNAWPASGKQKQSAADYSRKVDKQLSKEIKEAMDEADPGVEAQIEAAQGAIEEAKEVIDDDLIDRVDVEITGEVDSQERIFDLTFTPGEADEEEEDG